mmetsp:Transcript_26667/g.67741  ORF Transcript_26667/g.67741 Transcript_26667/m.67741 type:complete len:241 (-) Transcript_26667:1589-2311(-)
MRIAERTGITGVCDPTCGPTSAGAEAASMSTSEPLDATAGMSSSLLEAGAVRQTKCERRSGGHVDTTVAVETVVDSAGMRRNTLLVMSALERKCAVDVGATILTRTRLGGGLGLGLGLASTPSGLRRDTSGERGGGEGAGGVTRASCAWPAGFRGSSCNGFGDATRTFAGEAGLSFGERGEVQGFTRLSAASTGLLSGTESRRSGDISGLPFSFSPLQSFSLATRSSRLGSLSIGDIGGV